MILYGMTTIFCAGTLNAEDWPGWRGPRGDGISRDITAPLHWSPTENIAWRTPLPGIGLSSPIVIGNHVFVTAGDPTDETRRVICVDESTGKILWNVQAHQGPAGTMHRLNSTASSTPVSDGKFVFAAFADDKGLYVVAVDFEGKIIWSSNPGTYFSNHGFAASPVLYGEGVIVNGQQDGDAFVCMLHKLDGKELWRFKPKMNLRSFSTPVLTTFVGQDQLVLTGSSQTSGLDPKTGEQIWFADGPSQKFVCTPAVGHGMVYSFGGSPDKHAMALRLGGHGDVLATHLEWRHERSMPYVPSPILVGERLHVINDSGVYTCLDAHTGDILCSNRKLGSVYSSPVSVADRIYFFEDSGTCTIIQDGSDFQVLARNELSETVQTTPAVCHGCLYVRTESNLIRIGENAGNVARSVTPTIVPTVRLTEQGTKDQDDMCIWVDRHDPGQSTVIASDKSASQVVVYGLDGQILQKLDVPNPGNIDIRQNVIIDGQAMDLVVVNQRTDGFKLVVFRVDSKSRKLQRIDDACATDPNYGGCLYHSKKTGRLFFVCTSETGSVGQYELKGNGRNQITATKVRHLSIGKCEGAVADDEMGTLYVSEESKGVWKFAAEPDASANGTLIASVAEHGLKGDVEGLAIYQTCTGGYLLVSDQGRSRFMAYEREAPHQFVGEFSVEGATHTDGIDVTSANLGSTFPDGFFACHTDRSPRAVLVTPWGPIGKALSIGSAKK
jgi:myo-inositol-hexaphosphate 3-phosphohydrolase/outer membrane protein assembly factor BamB